MAAGGVGTLIEVYRRPGGYPKGGNVTDTAACCESCGSPEPDDQLGSVYRVYLETDGEGRVIGERVLPDLERWCVPCRTLYPNRPANDPGQPGAGTA